MPNHHPTDVLGATVLTAGRPAAATQAVFVLACEPHEAAGGCTSPIPWAARFDWSTRSDYQGQARARLPPGSQAPSPSTPASYAFHA